MSWQTAVTLGALACVALVVGTRNLVGVMRSAWAGHRSAAVVLGALTALVAVATLANPDVWPLFVVGYPSLASVVLEGWVHLCEAAERRSVLARATLTRARRLRTGQGIAIPWLGRPGTRPAVLRRI